MAKGVPYTKHHYVPQCLLNAFGHEIGKKKKQNNKFFLYGYSLERKNEFIKNTDECCQEENYYRISQEAIKNDPNLKELHIEVDFFSRQIEVELGLVFDNIEHHKRICIEQNLPIFQITAEEKYDIARQLVYQFLRHPSNRERVLSFFDETMPVMLQAMQWMASKQLNDPEIENMNIPIYRDKSLTHANLSFFYDDLAHKYTMDLCGNIWSFLYSPERNICTSDNPFVVYQQLPNERPLNQGLEQFGAVIFFAFSPDLLLIILDKDCLTDFVDCRFGTITEKAMSLYNTALCSQSKDVFNYNNNFDNIITTIYGQTENAKP